MEVLDAQSHTADTSPGFIDRTDVLLLLKANEAVRAHSPYSASNSAVLNTLLAHLKSSKSRPLQLLPKSFQAERASPCSSFCTPSSLSLPALTALTLHT